MIEIKDTAHYGFIDVSAAQLKRSLRQARYLVEFAEEIAKAEGPAAAAELAGFVASSRSQTSS